MLPASVQPPMLESRCEIFRCQRVPNQSWTPSSRHVGPTETGEHVNALAPSMPLTSARRSMGQFPRSGDERLAMASDRPRLDQ